MWGRHGRLAVAMTLLGMGSALAEEPGQGALACYQRAEDEVSLTTEQALRLCQGATSPAPAECYAEARAPTTFLSSEQAIALCRCSRSTEPVSCFDRADDETFLADEYILRLCSPSLSQRLLEDCQSRPVPVVPFYR